MEGRPKFIMLSAVLLIVLAVLFIPKQAHRNGTQYVQAKIVARDDSDTSIRIVRILSGPEKGMTVPATIGHSTVSLDVSPPPYEPGGTVLISSGSVFDNGYTIVDYYRIPAMIWLFVAVLLLAILFAGWRGVGALLGLVLSIVVLTQFVLPQIIHGRTPYLITAIGIMIISLPGIYIAHGISRRTSLALASTYMTLLLAVGLSVLAVTITRLSGVASETAWVLGDIMPGLNIRGLLLCGLLISLVGILDDITVGQAAAVQELHLANPKLTTRELYRRGLRIGREHIASLINTLVLVYFGASFLFIVYLAVTTPYPLLVVLNSEIIMEEIVRSLVGSATLILAVPLTTILAAKFLRQPTRTKPKTTRATAPK